jgi:SAM-dependent methyltransferase
MYEVIPDFGSIYDAVPLYAARTDVLFYVGEADKVKGPVLELGCGTGRVLLPLARAGHTIVGLDGSPQMLARCKAKLRDEPKAVRDRVTIHEGDVRSFDLGTKFALVIAPFRVVQQISTIDDQLRFLDAVARHVAPDGRFIFDVFNPNFASLISADGKEREDTPVQQMPDGRSFRRSYRIVRVRWIEQVSEVELLYYVSDSSSGTPKRHVQPFEMRWYLRAELVHLLARSGFRVDTIYGDFDRSPLTDKSPEQVVCATRQ